MSSQNNGKNNKKHYNATDTSSAPSTPLWSKKLDENTDKK